MSYVFLLTFFFAAAHFRLSGRQYFSFSHRCYKISRFSVPVKLVSLFFCPSLQLSLQLFLCYPRYVNVDIKIWSKERIGFAVVLIFFSLKVRRVAMRFTAKTRVCLKCKISPLLTRTGGHIRIVRTILSGPKFFECITKQIFLLMELRFDYYYNNQF